VQRWRKSVLSLNEICKHGGKNCLAKRDCQKAKIDELSMRSKRSHEIVTQVFVSNKKEDLKNRKSPVNAITIPISW
jgi:hypothetical protein